MLKKIIRRVVGKKEPESYRKDFADSRNLESLGQIRRIIAGSPVSSRLSIKSLLEGLSDEFYFWLITDGYNLDPIVRSYLPTMPSELIQASYTGSSGQATLREAYLAYEVFKRTAKSNSIDISKCSNILDFGCGWGRIMRFFLKDIESSALHGVDIDEAMITVCKQSNLNCEFRVISPLPPVPFAEEMFDIIYLYSVFTHLSEAAHLEWLDEFRRILKPGGLLIATTRPRAFILHCAELRGQNVETWQTGAARSFVDTEQMLRVYDSGEFCHSATGGGVVQDKSFYGETCISKRYAEKNWTKYFSGVDLVSDPDLKNYYQDIIIAVK